MGLVIDLTNTSRYYNSNEWTKDGVKYVKVPCRGRNEVPDNELVNTFVHEVNRFLHQQQGKGAAANNKYVLVHCTHGHNRTGFMIVHYLMRTQCSSVAQVYCYSLTAYFVVWLGFLACLLCFKTHEAMAAEGHLTG